MGGGLAQGRGGGYLTNLKWEGGRYANTDLQQSYPMPTYCPHAEGEVTVRGTRTMRSRLLQRVAGQRAAHCQSKRYITSLLPYRPLPTSVPVPPPPPACCGHALRCNRSEHPLGPRMEGGGGKYLQFRGGGGYLMPLASGRQTGAQW